MDFYGLNHFAPDGSLLLRECEPDLESVRKTALDYGLPTGVNLLRRDGDSVELHDGTTVRLDVL